MWIYRKHFITDLYLFSKLWLTISCYIHSITIANNSFFLQNQQRKGNINRRGHILIFSVHGWDRISHLESKNYRINYRHNITRRGHAEVKFYWGMHNWSKQTTELMNWSGFQSSIQSCNRPQKYFLKRTRNQGEGVGTTSLENARKMAVKSSNERVDDKTSTDNNNVNK